MRKFRKSQSVQSLSRVQEFSSIRRKVLNLINYFFLLGIFLLIKLVKPEIVLHYAYVMEHILSNFYIIMDPFNIYILIAFYIFT